VSATVQNFADGKVHSGVGSGSTVYTITGDRDFVVDAIERIKASYHPLGYGTHFSVPRQSEDGSWTAFGSRANSCD
jgi:hypothetical protein